VRREPYEPQGARLGGRTARTREAVFGATLAVLASQGYDRMSVEDVALQAGVHKTTVYRRWGTKDRLLAEALQEAAESRIEVPDTGDIGDDLRALASSIQATLSSREGMATVRALVSGARVSPEVERIARRFWAARLARVGPIVERAVGRGQLPHGTSATGVIEHVAAPLYYRLLIMDESPTEAVADRAAAAALAAARAGIFVLA
jgi:AcrR family transcriptional regulator